MVGCYTVPSWIGESTGLSHCQTLYHTTAGEQNRQLDGRVCLLVNGPVVFLAPASTDQYNFDAEKEATIMFDLHLSQREKEIDRQEALACAERDRLARQATGDRASRRWHLSLPLAAVFARIRASLMRARHAGRLEESTQR